MCVCVCVLTSRSSCWRVYREHDLVSADAQILPSLQPLMDQRLFDSAFNDFRFTFCEPRSRPVNVLRNPRIINGLNVNSWRISISLTPYAIFPLNYCMLCFNSVSRYYFHLKWPLFDLKLTDFCILHAAVRFSNENQRIIVFVPK